MTEMCIRDRLEGKWSISHCPDLFPKGIVPFFPEGFHTVLHALKGRVCGRGIGITVRKSAFHGEGIADCDRMFRRNDIDIAAVSYTHLGFEGGQMPLYRRLPKRGFTNRNSLDIEAINLGALEAFDNDAEVTVEALLEKGIIKSAKDGVKILGNGTLTKKLSAKVNAYSESAKAKIEEMGGKAEVI